MRRFDDSFLVNERVTGKPKGTEDDHKASPCEAEGF
jgi:hypothetical protein